MQDYLIYLIKTLKNKGIYSPNISYIKKIKLENILQKHVLVYIPNYIFI